MSAPTRICMSRQMREHALFDLCRMAQEARPDPDAVACLVHQVLAGRAEAFGRLYDLYIDMVYKYIYLACGHKETAQKVTEQAFLATLSNLRQTADGQSFAALLWRTAAGELQQALHGRSFRIAASTHAAGGAENSALLEAIRKFPPLNQQATILLIMCQLDLPEIAAVMQRNVGTVVDLLLANLETVLQTVTD